MSDSESDLEFESADEETEQDVSKDVKRVVETSGEPCVEICSAAKEYNEAVVEKDSQQVLNLEETQIEKNPSVLEKLENKDVSEDQVTELMNSVSVSDKQTPEEKQRVTLRLEKKLKKKNVSDQPIQETEAKESSSHASHCEDDKVTESSWGLGWGTSFFSGAVSTLTTRVSQIGAAVESSLGAPPPEELAQSTPGTEKGDVGSESASPGSDAAEPQTSLLGDVSAWTRVLESTGSKVLSGGLGTLELIGKKTMDLLTEGDPGLRNTRAALSQKTETLSKILREAKARDSAAPEREDSLPSYSQLLDDHQGLAHLEALEMVSRHSRAALSRLPTDSPGCRELEEMCKEVQWEEEPSESESYEDFETVLKWPLFHSNLGSLIQAHQKMRDISQFDRELLTSKTPQEVLQSCLVCLAQFTSRCMEAFHRMAEREMAGTMQQTDVQTLAEKLKGLCSAMCVEVNHLATQYQQSLESHFAASEGTNFTVLATNLYVEAENSNRYIRDSFQLLLPVLQVALLQQADPS